MIKQKIQLAIFVATIGLAARAQAAFLSETVSVAPTPASSLEFDFAQFDAALGTLNSVDLILTPVVGDIGYDVYNFGATSQAVSFAQVSDPDGTLVNSTLGLSASWSSGESHQRDNFTANPGFNTGSLPFSSFDIMPSSIMVGPAGFTGMGTYALTVDSSAFAFLSSGSSGYPLFYGWYGNVGGSLQVVFNYTAIPESAATGICAGLAALGALLVVFRKRLPKKRGPKASMGARH